MEALSTHFPWRYEPEGSLLGVYNDDFSISLEPAGQLEVSINPKEDISLIYRIYRMFLEQITPILKDWGYEMLTLGYHPGFKGGGYEADSQETVRVYGPVFYEYRMLRYQYDAGNGGDPGFHRL